LMWGAKTWRERAVHMVGVAIVMVVMIVSLLPWEWRNQERFSPARVRFTTLEGISLYEAVYPGATGGPRQDVIELPVEMKALNEAQRDAEWSRRAWQCVRDDPGRMAVLAVRKVGRMWSPVLNAVEFRNAVVQIALAVWYVPMFLMALVGVVAASARCRCHGILLVVPLVYFTAVHAVFLGSVRYRVPLTPLLSVFAAVGIGYLLQYANKRKQEVT